MKVSLISVTPDALNLLLGTKSTRMRGADPATMTDDERRSHWAYMLDTIRSPFEFVDYIFQIEDVSKNFTHQLVRTRTGAYQQETSRALDQSDNPTIKPDNFGDDDPLSRLFHDAVADANAHYQQLLAAGAELQDARSILPSNMATKITAKFNLRTLSDMAKNRLCARTQGEYQNVFRAMRALVVAEHPWADALLQVACVATGQCAFPRWGGKIVDGVIAGHGSYSEWLKAHPEGHVDNFWIANPKFQCSHYRPWMDLTKQKEELRVQFWSKSEIEQANPIAANGVSM